jgi:hypothetical protein
MKKVLFISMLAMAAIACSNAKTESQEESSRDSLDQAKLEQNEAYLDSIEKAEEMKDHGHNHDHPHDHGDSGHTH